MYIFTRKYLRKEYPNHCLNIFVNFIVHLLADVGGCRTPLKNSWTQKFESILDLNDDSQETRILSQGLKILNHFKYLKLKYFLFLKILLRPK